jgi:outer membrane biosynthesis protein TonB
MSQRRLTAAVLSAVAGVAVAGSFAGTANASSASSPSQEPRTTTPTKPSDSAGPTTSPTAAPRPAQISGQIIAVDAANGTISIATSLNGRNTTITLKVGVNASALVDGVVTTLANVPIGAQVQVGGNDGGPLLRVTSPAKPLQLEGTLVGVNPTAGTVSVKLPTMGATLQVSADAKVTLDGAAVALGALPAGAMLRLSGTESGTVRLITKIEARSVRPAPAPKPTTSEAPKPAVTTTPKPSEPPKPIVTTVPKPSEPPKPAVTTTPKPSEPPKPIVTTVPQSISSPTAKPSSR